MNNLFLTPGDLAADEWRASRAADEESAEREMRQFVWAVPVAPAALSTTSLEVHELAARAAGPAKGLAPAAAAKVTVGIDLGKYLCHWAAVAWSPGATGHVLDYGRHEVATDDLGLEQALMVALRELKAELLAGWAVAGPDGGKADPGGKRLVPELCLIDAGYMAPVVYAFCREAGDQRFKPAVGRGAGQHRPGVLDRAAQTGSVVRAVGEGYHASWLPAERVFLVEADADHWKSWAHQRLATPVGSPGALTFYRPAAAQEHLSLCKHLTAESRVEEFVAGKGVVTRWERIRKQNHWLDAVYNACVAGHGCGVRLVEEQRPAPPPRPAAAPPSDYLQGRPKWLDSYRPGEWARRW